MWTQKGVTLLELRVVVAIIALLMSILMPALQRVKKQAHAVTCMSHLKQWGLIFAMYADEGDNRRRFCMNRHTAFLNGLFLDFSVRKVGLRYDGPARLARVNAAIQRLLSEPSHHGPTRARAACD